MTIDQLTSEEKNETGRTFLNLVNSHQYEQALLYYRRLNNLARNYIRTNGDCNWGLLLAVDATRPKEADNYFRLLNRY